MSITTLEAAREATANMRAKAADYGREVGVLSNAVVICRETEAEAQAVYDAILAQGDWEGAQNVMDTLGIESQSFGEQIRDFQAQFVIGFGAHVILGSPEQVVEHMRDISDAGVDGLFMGLPDYVADLDFFGERVMPLMVEAGLRH
jgi:alkanesulfonate monooxygenase SsuD/methylene tetrahydromethanopterin reductase-like flavin-dependent oxidoreductase (luciferase family)